MEPTAQQRMSNLRHELARWIWSARRDVINVAAANQNLSDLTALCPDGIIEHAIKLKHAVNNQLEKLVGRQYMRIKGIDKTIECHALKMRELKN
jgi:hypothetical protein